jgi:putative addiction module component (TIGR02574 family)
MTYAEIEEQARQLSPEERARLADVMLESLLEIRDPEIDEAWDREIERRLDRLDRGESKTYSTDEVLAEARRRSQWPRRGLPKKHKTSCSTRSITTPPRIVP